jgi:phosphoenolpyruvate synthase/pyruvate phosphate dikinase
MMNVGDPEHAFALASLPNDGVGLARLEFIINNHIGIHPMALVNYPKLATSRSCTKSRSVLARKTRANSLCAGWPKASRELPLRSIPIPSLCGCLTSNR